MPSKPPDCDNCSDAPAIVQVTVQAMGGAEIKCMNLCPVCVVNAYGLLTEMEAGELEE